MNAGRNQASRPRLQAGFGLVELMVSILLGLMVVVAASAIFLANKRTYTATEGLSRVQENSRVAFELMSRDIREASGNGCVSAGSMIVNNALNSPASRWWSNWMGGTVQGFAADTPFADQAFGTAAGQRLSGTQAIVLLSSGTRTATVTAHNAVTSQFTMANNAHGFSPGDVLLVCGPNSEPTGVLRLGAIFQMTGTAGTTAIGHVAGGTSPGNSSANLGLGATPFHFAANSTISNLNATRWYIANNGRGTRSLYRGTLGTNGAVQAVEVAEGVDDLDLTYLLSSGDSFIGPAAVGTRWNEVSAVRLELAQRSPEAVGEGGEPIRREMASVVTLRNRNP